MEGDIMNKYLKRIVPLVASGLMVIGLAGCQKPNSQAANGDKKEVIEIKWPTFRVGTDVGAKYLSDFVERFNKENEGKIKIVIEEVPGQDNLINKLKTLTTANELPDIIEAPYNILDVAANQNKLVDLTPYLNADSDWKSSVSQRGLDYNTRNGKIYGIPTERTLIGYYYNKELFAKAGIEPAKTWEDFWSNCDKLTAAGAAPLSMDTAETGWLTNLVFGALIGTSGDEGNKFMNTSRPKDYNKSYIVDAAKKLQIAFQKYTTKDAVGGKYDNGANNFFSGKTAIIANGPWMMADFKDETKAPKGFNDKVGIATFPGGMNDGAAYGVMIGSRDKTHADAAAIVLKAYTSPQQQVKQLELAGNIPDSPKAKISDEYQKTNPLVGKLLEYGNSNIKYRYTDYQTQWYANVTDGISNLLPDLALNKMTAEEFCKQLTELAQKNQD
jgi:raffinose/stachyose/melibiose transport system substrate-binding protein